MRAAVIESPGRLTVKSDVPLPQLGEYDALVRIVCCSTCNGTDSKLVAGELGEGRYPSILGHESVGRVHEVGPEVRAFETGDLVLRPSAVYPGEHLGDYASAWGGYAEWGKVTDLLAAEEDGKSLDEFSGYSRFQRQVPEMAAPDAAMLITLREAKSWLNRMDVGKGDSLLVIGDGPVAAVFVALAAATKVNPIVALGHRDERLGHLSRLGAKHALNARGRSALETVQQVISLGIAPLDGVVDTVVSLDLLSELQPFMASGKRPTVYGTPIPGVREETLRSHQISFDEAETHDEVLKLINEGRIQPTDFYGPVVPLSEINHAFDLIRKRKVHGKVIIALDESMNE